MVKHVFLILTLLASLNTWAKTIATLDRKNISINETVTLSIISDNSDAKRPNLDALANSFDILSNSQSSNMSYVNGKYSHTKRWEIQLDPKQTGSINIAPISVGNESTQAITLNVSKSNNNPSTGNVDNLFVEAETDTQEAVVQQQVTLNLRFNDAIGIYDLKINPLDIPNAIIKELGQAQYSRNIAGRQYQTYEIRYAIFPQKSGKLDIPAITFSGVIPSRNSRPSIFSRGGKPVQIKSDPISITVNTPQNSSGAWLPAQNIQLFETYSANPQSLQVGDSITRTITIKAQGLSKEQLPAIAPNDVNGAKFYQDKAETKDAITNGVIESMRIEKHTYVLTQEGKVTLPAINIDWYNTKTKTNETATLDATELMVQANPELANTQSSTPTIATTKNSNAEPTENNSAIVNTPIANTSANVPNTLWPWQLACAILSTIVLWLLWLLYQRSKTQPVTQAKPEGSAWQNLEFAVKQKDKVLIKQRLLQYLREQNAGKSLYSLTDIKRLYTQQDFRTALDELDQSMLSNKTYHGKTLIDILKNLEQNSSKQQGLPELYP